MPSTKVWSASSFLTLWVCFQFPSARLHSEIPCCSYLLIISALSVPSHSSSSSSSPPQAYADSDVDLFTWGTPITTLALFTILVHLGIETKTWVRNLILDSFLSLIAAFSHSDQHIGFVGAPLWRLTGTWICNSSWLDWTRKLCSIRAEIYQLDSVSTAVPLQTGSTTSQHTATSSCHRAPKYSPPTPHGLPLPQFYPQVSMCASRKRPASLGHEPF